MCAVMSTPDDTTIPPSDFIRDRIREDLASGKHTSVHTRFPPEPNGYPHIGHAKAISINFGIAEEFGGLCNLRFDDTNPVAEDIEYVAAIQEDIRWLGYDWGDRLFFASDYFEQLYDWAVLLIEKGSAYVDDSTIDEIRAGRGSLTEPGVASPYRSRTIDENLELFRRMRAGDFDDGHCVLRAKIDMAAKNLQLRDPVMYRIKRATHHRTGDAWCIYPTYDWAHGQSDAIEGITHSLCSLEFENHRPLYDWFLEQIGLAERPQQMEFARLNITHTLVAKRNLRELVESGLVSGWDDPRFPTLRGMRRRGYTPEALRNFCKRIGVARFNSMHEMALLEHTIREDLNLRAERRMAVLRPLKLIIDNWPVGTTDSLEAVNNPEDASAGTRMVPFSGELWIERGDFMEDAPKKFYRLAPGREVRLRYAYFVTCTGVDKDADGNIVAIHCSYDPATRGGSAPDGRKVKGTIHWVSAAHATAAEVRLYDHLFASPNPNDVPAGGDFKDNLNPDSLETLTDCKLEPSLAEVAPGTRLQFERLGYFCADSVDHTPAKPVFNRTVALRDSWAKLAKKNRAQSAGNS